jgi:tight adherence protein C
MDQLLSGDVIYYGLLALVGGSIAAAIFGMRYLFAARVDPMQERIRRSVGQATPDMPAQSMAPRAEPGHANLLDLMLKPVASVARPTDEEELGALRSKLAHAGYRSERAMVLYLVAKLVLCLGFAAAFLMYNARSPQPMRLAAFYTVLSMVFGFYLPNFWLSQRVNERQKAVGNSLPDALDLLVTCVEAGLGLEQALGRVSQEVGLSAPLLAAELNQTSLEMRAGVPRGEAFRRLANRTGIEEIKSLASLVIQTEIFGTSVARSLRVMSESMRLRRMQRAEERAAMVAVKMTLPLIIFIMPSLFIVLMGPAVVRIARIMMPGLEGQ